MDLLTQKIRKRYNRASRFYDLMGRPMEMMIPNERRIQPMKGLKGNVLEVSV